MAEWIDEAGGEVASADGRLRVKIPAGAWTGRRQVEIGELPALATATIGGRTIRGVRHVRLVARDDQGREDSASFAHAVELSLQLGGDDLAHTIAPRATFAWWNPAAAAWEEVLSTFDRPTLVLTAHLPHFSEYLGAVGDDSNVLPTVDGFAVDVGHGNASVSLPLKVLPGPHGFQPSLTLTYSSGGPNGVISEYYDAYRRSQGSWVGFGWDLTLGYVLGVQWMTNTQRVYLILNNRTYDLIATKTFANSSEGRVDTLYRTQNDEFLWIRECAPQLGDTSYHYFLVRAKDGTEYRYGYEPSDLPPNQSYYEYGSRQDGVTTNGAWVPLRWYLDQITDPLGNQITITYYATKGSNPESNWDLWVYPSEIDYCSTNGGNTKRKIGFNLRGRTINGVSDEPGSEYYFVDQLLDSIDESDVVNGTSTLVRKYVFGYDNAPHGSTNGGSATNYQDAGYTGDSKTCDLALMSITECDGTASPGVCGGAVSGNTLPSTTFQYTIFQGWVGDGNGTPPQKCPMAQRTYGGRAREQAVGGFPGCRHCDSRKRGARKLWRGYSCPRRSPE